MSVAQLPIVESPLHALDSLRERFGASVHKLTSPFRIADLSLNNAAGNLVIVELPESWGAIGECRHLFNYYLVSPVPCETVVHGWLLRSLHQSG